VPGERRHGPQSGGAVELFDRNAGWRERGGEGANLAKDIRIERERARSASLAKLSNSARAEKKMRDGFA